MFIYSLKGWKELCIWAVITMSSGEKRVLNKRFLCRDLRVGFRVYTETVMKFCFYSTHIGYECQERWICVSWKGHGWDFGSRRTMRKYFVMAICKGIGVGEWGMCAGFGGLGVRLLDVLLTSTFY